MALHDKPDSLWLSISTVAEDNPPLEGDLSCDVVVIGAGFTGLRAALKLAEAGSQVVVVDAGDVGFGASGRNGGQVNPLLPFNTPAKVRERVGSTHFERLTEASLGSADRLFNMIEKYQIDCQARQDGWLRVDHSPKVFNTSRKTAEAWNELGADIRFVEGDELQKMTGSPLYRTGVLVPKGGAVQPMSLARGLARVAKGAGTRIFGKTPATAIRQETSGWTVETTRGTIQSKWVILATNGYTDHLWKSLKSSLFPIVSIQIATEQLSDGAIASILPGGQTIADTRRVIMYARRERDNRIVFGGHGKITRDGRLTGFDWLKREAVRVFPALKDANWQFEWGGRLALTDDRLPHFHEPAKGLVAGMGYNGRGVAMSHVMGEALADRVLGAAPENLPFPISKIERIPFREVQLLGKGTAIWWMQMLDAMEMRRV